MSSLSFSNSYSTILAISRKCGLPLPMLTKVSTTTVFLHFCLERIVVIFLVYKISCSAYATGHNEKLEDKIYGFSVLVFQLTSFLITVFYWVMKNEFKELIGNLDKLTLQLQSCGLGHQEIFLKLHKTDSFQITIFVKAMAVTSVISPFCLCLSVPVFGAIKGNYGENPAVPTQCSFEVGHPSIYELLVFQQFLGFAVPGVHKVLHDCIVIALFKIHVSYFKYLSLTLRTLGEDLTSQSDFQRKLIVWLKLHQQIVSSSISLVRFYSPIIMMYYFSIIGIVAGAILYALRAKEVNVLQFGFQGAYMGIIMFRWYLQCHMAGDLTTEANNIAFEMYCIPWYELSQKTKGFVGTVINMANRAFNVDAFRCPGFRMNQETYQGFCVSIVSSYLAFSKMLEINE
nr:olfactory receptor 67 [Tropidothorax elegans]